MLVPIWSPLLNSAYNGDFETVKMLVEAKANINVRMKDYLNALEYTDLGFYQARDYNKRMQYLNIMEILEQAGAIRSYDEE